MMSNKGNLPDVADLPKLTEQRRKFVEGLAVGKSQTDAYRDAYSCEGMAPTTLWAEASRLVRHPKVAPWVEALKASDLESIRCTREQHLKDLAKLRDQATDKDQFGAAVAAEKARGQVSGFYEKRLNITSLDLNKLYEQISSSKRTATLTLDGEYEELEGASK